MDNILVLDVGGSSIKHALVAPDRTISEQGKAAAPRDTKEHFIEVVEGLWRTYADRAEGMAISMAGKLDPKDGLIISAGSFPALNGERLVPLLQNRCGCRVSVENDGTCAGLAEFHYGSLKGYRNALCVVLGTGIGAALFIDGKVYRGSHFRAPEPSLVRADGQAGLMHSWTFSGGATGLVKMAQAALGTKDDLDGVQIMRMASQGDERILNMLEEYAQITAVQLYNIQALLDLDALCVGGGISGSDMLMDLIGAKLQAIFDAEAHHNFPPVAPKFSVATFRNDANLIGAWHHYVSVRS